MNARLHPIRALWAGVVIALLVHAACLRFVFPGYYDPLWPLHSDFYMPLSLAQAGPGLFGLASWPRPVGTMFMKLSGYAGLHGSIAIFIAIVLANLSLSAAFASRLLAPGEEDGRLPRTASAAAFAAYAAFAFVHPHFYEFYTHDMLAQLSFMFMAAAGGCAWRYASRGRRRWLLASFALALAAFQTKETYAVSALVLVASSLVFPDARSRWRRVALVGIAWVLALAAALARILGSPFAGKGAEAGSTYDVVLSPDSIAREWWRFVVEGGNPYAWAAVGASLLAMAWRWGWRDPRTAFVCALPVAGLAALLPNSVLPGHHYEGYSWNGSYLTFLPVACLAWALAGRTAALAAAGALGLALTLAVQSNQPAYARDAWHLENEARQRTMVRALTRFGELLPPDGESDRVLVTGIRFPFSPFDHGGALKSFPRLGRLSFDVAVYPAEGVTPAGFATERVKFVPVAELRLDRYDRVLAFDGDGSLVLADRLDDARDRLVSTNSPFGPDERLIYPRLIRLFGLGAAPRPPTGYDYLACGQELAQAAYLPGAERCLREAVTRIPGNPYPYFFLGGLLERRGDKPAALASYRRAFEVDNPANRNPHFAAAIARLEP